MKSKILLIICGLIISGTSYGKKSLPKNYITNKAANPKVVVKKSKGFNMPESTLNTNYFYLLPPPIAWNKVEDTDPGWSWVGFEEDGCGTCSGGSAYSYEFVGGTAEYTFSGTDLEVYAETYDAAGSIEIFIDGVSKGIFTEKVEPYGGAMKFASVSNLTSGVHNLKMVSVPEVGTGYTSWVGIDFIRFGDFIPGSVSEVSLNKSTANITLPNTEQLEATIMPQDATNKELAWLSDDITVATVSSTGLVTPVSVGTAFISVTSLDNSEKMAICQVNVEAPDLWSKADNADPNWIFTNFTNGNCTGCYRANAHYTSTIGSTAEYTFTGTDVEAYAEKFAGAGTVEILIDGVSKGIFAQNIEPFGGGLKFATFTGLSNMSHNIKFVSQGADFSNIDYLRYTVLNTTPLTLVSFSGKATSNGNTLIWETKDEVNVKGFEVEKSADGVQFNQIAVVNSKGGGNYSTEDRSTSGDSYYRLKMVDKDGTYKPSKIIFIKEALKQNTIFTIYPNPVKDKVTISPSDISKAVKVTLFDLQGKKILTKNIVGNTEISLGNLAKGVYIIQLINKGEINTLKLVKD